MGREVYCSSSRALYAQRAGAGRRSRTTHILWQKLCAGNTRDAVCVRASSAREHFSAVRVRAGRVYGCGVLACGQKTIDADAERVHGARIRTWTVSYRHIYILEARGKEGR